MTAPLNDFLSVGETVSIGVDMGLRHLYWPEYLHHQTGKVWQLDDEHIWVMGSARGTDGFIYPSGPHRYPWTDITVALI